MVAETEIGHKVKIELWRNKQRVPLTVDILEMPEETEPASEKTTAEPERKTSLRIIEMVGGYSQVGQNRVCFINTIVAHEIVQIPEIASYKRKSLIVYDVFFCILVLVKTQQFTFRPQFGQNAFRMSASSESDVYIGSVRINIHPADTLFQ